jgi:phage gpG-like protein
MKEDKDKRGRQSGKPEKNPRQNPRQDRLKLALRENLKRRKSQARGRDDFAGAGSNTDQAALHDDGEKAPGE